MWKIKFISYIIICCIQIRVSWGQENTSVLQFETLELPQGGWSKEVRQIYQDKEGYIWIATNSGLLRYDGYEYVSYKSDFRNRDLLSDNSVQAIAGDNDHNLLIGTAAGLNVLHKPTGEIRKIPASKLDNSLVQCLLVTREGKIWVGTNGGIYEYLVRQDSFRLFPDKRTGGNFNVRDIKSLCEDSRGQIWIGTWSAGLYRYDPLDSVFYAYPSFNPRNSAHVVYEDREQNIWVGTWGYGLYRIRNAGQPDKAEYIAYRNREGDERSVADNVIYCIAEDKNTGKLWIGSPKGISILGDKSDPLSFRNYFPGNGEHTLSFNEVNSILCDNNQFMWLGMLGGGICRADTRKQQFNLHRLGKIKNRLMANSVRSLMQDDEGKVWLGVRNFGWVMHDPETGKYTHYSEFPDFRSVSPLPTINTILQRRESKELWFGTYGDGIYIYDKYRKSPERVRRIYSGNASWLLHDCIYQLLEDRENNIWIATREGVNVITPDGAVYGFRELRTVGRTFHNPVVNVIGEDAAGNIWLGVNRYGIFRLCGDFRKPEEVLFINYSAGNQNLLLKNSCCFFADREQRLWVGTEGEGLVLYDPQQDRFQGMQDKYRLPGDAVYSMEEDRQGNLWLGTNAGLVRLTVSGNPDSSSFRLYTAIDGLQDNSFVQNAAWKNDRGELLFGGHKGYNSFFPQQLQENTHIPPVVVTDIKIYNQSWNRLEPERKQKISAKAPGYTRKIVLSHRDNNLSIHFAVLSYAKPEHNKYSYYLEGFDKDWKYTDASQRFAYYNNLKSGQYHFYLRGANEHGVWNPVPLILDIIVKPAPWATWWAYCLYALVCLLIGWYIFRLLHKRLQIETAMKLAEVRRQKSEEMNHAKLQFFTNITHELMTPLTIISAALDELRLLAPAHTDYYDVLSNNTKRLMRLIQQILEFRKAESGNLKLKVSAGNLSRFVRNSVDSFRPLIKKKGISFSLHLEEPDVYGYFDPDKLDKILYNLLSNAAKYNRESGAVEVVLSHDETLGCATFSVKDNGEGISSEAMKNLFKRFYEGNYRRFNTVGTGIGLSLTKDLVDLHQGTIRVESEKGKGAKFVVTIPLKREAYLPEQIDDENPGLTPREDLSAAVNIREDLSTIAGEEETDSVAEEAYTLLLVEDNEELLQLMTRLLSREYRIVVAHNGREGIEVVEKENVDLIISDVMMPEIDGIEFCRYVKEKFELCHIPVILLTAKQSEEDKIIGYDSGADSYLTKPFSLSLLHARIKSVLCNRERIARDFKKQMLPETKELSFTSMDEDFIRRAMDCVYRHMDDPDFDVEQFVSEMGTSKSTLYTKLKSLTGLHTTAFIRNIRLKAACRLIEEKKNVRVSELAYAVGFNDAKYFSTCFKKEFGLLPTDYMEKYNQGESTVG